MTVTGLANGLRSFDPSALNFAVVENNPGFVKSELKLLGLVAGSVSGDGMTAILNQLHGDNFTEWRRLVYSIPITDFDTTATAKVWQEFVRQQKRNGGIREKSSGKKSAILDVVGSVLAIGGSLLGAESPAEVQAQQAAAAAAAQAKKMKIALYAGGGVVVLFIMFLLFRRG